MLLLVGDQSSSIKDGKILPTPHGATDDLRTAETADGIPAVG